MIELQALVNKTVDFRFHGADLKLDLSHALFSSFDVDVGTKLLFKAVGRDEILAASKRVLDAGSGVGVIGLGIAAAFPGAQVTLRDRDSLALAFSERNRLRNHIENASVEGGLIGAESLGRPWDFILSNIPAKAGGPVIRAFLAEARQALAPGGRLALVVVKPLVDEVRAALAELGYSIIGEERGAMHRAFVAQPPSAEALEAAETLRSEEGESGTKTGASGFDLRHYRRRSGDFKLYGKTYQAQGFWGLPDFDTIGYPQLAATEIISRFASGSHVEEALVVNPGIGHSALWLALSLKPKHLSLASRDLLALEAARENLASLEEPPLCEIHDVLRLDELPEASFDLILDFADPIPEYDWIAPTWARSARLLRPGGTLVVAAPPTELVRLEKRRGSGWKLLGEKRKKGSAAVAWRRI